MNQKGFAGIIVLIVLAVVLASALGYVTLIKKPATVEQTQSNNLQNTQQPTAQVNWQTYSNNDSEFPVTFKYPNGWTVNSISYATPAQAAKNQSGIVGYKLVPGTKKTPYDTIEIGGLQFTCLVDGQYESRCVSTKEADEVHTQSKDIEVLKVFDLFVKQFTIVKDYKTPTSALPISCKDEPEGQPVIISISPESGPVGTKIEIKGCNFAGFEGDKYAWILNSKGEKAILGGSSDSTNNLLRPILRSPLCTADTSYSGKGCPGYLTIIPGVYKIYVMPWGKKSNEAAFTVTQY